MRVILLVTILLLALGSAKNRQMLFQKANRSQLILLGFIFFAFMSTAQAQASEIAIMGFISLVETCSLFFIGLGIFQKEKNRKIFLAGLIGVSIFFGSLGTLQLILSRPLGLLIESRKDTFSDLGRGFLTSDGNITFRSAGTASHATFFASTLTLILPIICVLLIKHLEQYSLFSKTQWIEKISLIWALVSGMIALYATKSRSGWLAFLICILFLLFRYRQQLLKTIILQSKARFFLFLLGALFLLFILSSNSELITRLQSLEFYNQYGNGSGRTELMRHSFLMISEAPFLGVGLHSFTAAMMAEGIRNGYGGFIYPVHNIFLLFFSELGIPAGLLFCLFCLSVIKNFPFSKPDTPLIILGIWLGLFTFILNGQVHTLFTQGPSLHYFFLLCALIMQEEKAHETSANYFSGRPVGEHSESL